MKKVEAIVKPFKLDEVKDALAEVGIQGMTVTGGEGLWSNGRQKRGLPRVGVRGRFRSQSEDRSGRPGWACPPSAPKRSRRAPRTGRIGDGKIFVVPIEEAVRIRTGERGEEAI